VTSYLHHVLPSGMAITLAVPDPEVASWYAAAATKVIPFKSPAELRAEAAAKVLAVFREHGIDPQRAPEPARIVEAGRGRIRRLKAEPYPVFGSPGPLDTLRFEYEVPPREPSKLDYGALLPLPMPPVSWII